jgi:hypothetical protein
MLICKGYFSVRKNEATARPHIFFVSWRFESGRAGVSHIFCGQNCEQGLWASAKSLIPHEKTFLLKFQANPGFPQLSACCRLFSAPFIAAVAPSVDISSRCAHKMWKRM